MNGLNRRIHNILGYFYNFLPGFFWENWSRSFMDDPWQKKIFTFHKWILAAVKKEKSQNILEVGCGFGRNIKYLIDNGIDPQIITGVDISKGMIKKAKDFINNDKVVLKTANCLDLPFTNKSFDLVLVYTVLMHIPPNEINDAISEIKRVSNRTIIVIEQNYEPIGNAVNAKKYTFIHDYKKLFNEHSLKILKYSNKVKEGNDYYVLKI